MKDSQCDLSAKSCVPCEGGTVPLTESQSKELLADLKDWQLNVEFTSISREFEFKNYYKTMAFVNAMAWVAHKEGHHPDLYVTFNTCVVTFTTHSINGLSENDFICAAKVSKIFE